MRRQSSATAPIKPSYFRDSDGTKQILLAVPPPAPIMPGDEQFQASSRPGSRTGRLDNYDSSDESREDYNDRLQDTAFSVMENVEESAEIDGAVADPQDGDHGSDDASIYSDPGMYNESLEQMLPSYAMEKHGEELKEAELKIAIWDTDVAAAALRSEIFEDTIPRPTFQTSIDAGACRLEEV